MLAALALMLTWHNPLKPVIGLNESYIVNKTEGVPNFCQVHSYMYRGAQPNLDGLKNLQQLGIKTIIDLRRTRLMVLAEGMAAEQLGMKHVSIPVGNFVPPLSKQQQFLRILQQAETDPNVGPVFIHCSHGSDRAGFMTALWRVTHDNWSLAQAMGEMLSRGFLIHKFMPQHWDAELFG